MSDSPQFACVRRWGRHSLAYSILQPGMRYFGDAATGMLAFRRRLGVDIVLADPLCPAAHAPELLAAFLRAHPRAAFMQVTLATARLLEAHGFHATPVGVENEIDTDSFSLTGKRKRDLRHYRNKALDADIEVREEIDSPALREELRPVSDSWLPMKSWHQHELEFLARPFQGEPEPAVRIFTGRLGPVIKGFVILDPMFDEGRCIGYVVTLLRHTPDAPEGTVDFINLHVIACLSAERVPLLSLGVSPFHRMKDLTREHGAGLPLACASFHVMHHFGAPLYHFRGLSFHKSRYRARELPVFTCVRPPLGVWPLVASARACRMV